LWLGLSLTVLLSLAEILIIQQNAETIALRFLGDVRCTELLVIISYALPCAAVHSCICGYCYGVQKAEIPAVSQLIEQTVLLISVVSLLVLLLFHRRSSSVIFVMVVGLIVEFASVFCPSRALSKTRKKGSLPNLRSILSGASELIPLSLPLPA